LVFPWHLFGICLVFPWQIASGCSTVGAKDLGQRLPLRPKALQVLVGDLPVM
jgi:hypothetical protein